MSLLGFDLQCLSGFLYPPPRTDAAAVDTRLSVSSLLIPQLFHQLHGDPPYQYPLHEFFLITILKHIRFQPILSVF